MAEPPQKPNEGRINEAGSQPPTMPDQVELQIRFGLTDLTSRNAAHPFEELCRHFAQARLVSNVLPATGPVSSGGDQGRDFETFRTFLRQELGPHGAFLGLVADGPVAFACTLQQDNVATKVRSDIKKILSSGTEVTFVYTFCTGPMPVATRHQLQGEIKDEHGVEAEIFDQHALAAQLACPDLFWLAAKYLSLPASLAPRRDGPLETSQPAWYADDLERWRERGGPRPLLPDVLDIRDGLRHATFDRQTRADLPFWLGLMRAALVEGAGFDIRQRARYEVAVATIRGTRELRNADPEVRAYMTDALEGEDDPAHLEDAVVLLSYTSTAALYGRTSVTPEELTDWLAGLCARVREGLEDDPPPTRRARLLQVRGQLGLLHDPSTVTEPEQPMELPDAADLIDEQGAVRAPRLSGLVTARRNLVDVDDAMDAWAELASRLSETPLFPVDALSDLLGVLAPVLVDHPRWPEIVEAVDDAVARTQGGAAAAGRARDRALGLLEAERLREALHELHRAKEGWWSGDALRGALLIMLGISECHARLNLPLAAKQYALAVAGAAHSGTEDLLDLVPRGLLVAADVDYAGGAWCSALELLDLGLIAQDLLVDESLNEAARTRTDRAIVHLGMLLRGAKALSSTLAPRVQEVARRHGALEPLQRVIDDSEDWDAETHVRLADEQLQGRPFSDLGAERVLRFTALGVEWRVRSPNDYRHVLAAERLAAAAQIMSVDLADDDLCLLPTTVDVHVELLEGSLTEEGRAEQQPSNNGREWIIRLTPFEPGQALDPEANFHELLAVLSMIFLDLSLLSKARYFEGLERAMERGLWHKIGSGRPYDELAAVVSGERFEAVRRREFEPPADPLGAPLRQHTELAWQDGPGPTYSKATAREMLRNRYEQVPSIMRRTLPRLQRHPAFRSTVVQLRAAGWLDWHLLTGAYNILLQFRLAHAGLNTREALEAHGAAKATRELAFTPEGDEEPEAPLDAFSTKDMRWGLKQSIPSTVANWDLHPRSPYADYPAFERLLAERYGYWRDDVDHEDPFPQADAQAA